MARGNIDKLQADADGIVRRYLSGESTFSVIQREYHVAYPTLMRLLKSRLSARQLKRCRRRNNARGGVDNQFQKGHEPWNAGIKGLHFSPETEFKTGCLRGQAARNWRPIGTITVRYDKGLKLANGRRSKRKHRKRRYIKVKDDGPMQNRWIPMARFNWEEANGPIPKGFLIVMVDGCSMCDSLGNLRMVNRKQHNALQILRNPAQLVLCRQRAGAASRLRHCRNRTLKEIQGAALAFWECPACGNEVFEKDIPDRCTKCGSAVFVKSLRRKTA